MKTLLVVLALVVSTLAIAKPRKPAPPQLEPAFRLIVVTSNQATSYVGCTFSKEPVTGITVRVDCR